LEVDLLDTPRLAWISDVDVDPMVPAARLQ
jgi:hypothetical protein